MVASAVFLSGVQLIVLGMIGEYIEKIYREVIQPPVYFISKTNISVPNNSWVEESHNLDPIERRAAMDLIIVFFFYFYKMVSIKNYL